MENRLKKQLRQIAHHLDAIVSVGDQGVSDALVKETHRALTDHELIKVRLHTPSREERTEHIKALANACSAEIVQKIGKIVVIYRANPEADPRLSNLHRAGSR
ncbi:MAG: ribosome assembly RNA-binding protein YhbY [Pseudomonadales bacterium]|jgi:RNA-binding protein|nr:ribosome assembly RNA-binding protein YhbY [Pseudomonadales bacterium]MDP6469631.1 ribosome assembly RNA-binding protein YhbY [Pseudomonadales bacterium]MDP6827472.1 ribosome assembly RNA-binding protein YhbY [Pseudomonadales bacterium]MDP6973032.1 ribosome assembly RNA-binding protein YhbY [Pseudomonadales bacterium]|tara:strand:+ start:3238 stop:3546 length:309 start_codon:yes stop_codon:yes gene_type:complete